jgi:hypothetical protein
VGQSRSSGNQATFITIARFSREPNHRLSRSAGDRATLACATDASGPSLDQQAIEQPSLRPASRPVGSEGPKTRSALHGRVSIIRRSSSLHHCLLVALRRSLRWSLDQQAIEQPSSQCEACRQRFVDAGVSIIRRSNSLRHNAKHADSASLRRTSSLRHASLISLAFVRGLDHQVIEQPSSHAPQHQPGPVPIIRRSSSLRHKDRGCDHSWGSRLDHQAIEQPSSQTD